MLSAILCGLSSLTSLHSSLLSDWKHTVSSKFFDIQVQVPSVSTEELVLCRHARSVLSLSCLVVVVGSAMPPFLFRGMGAWRKTMEPQKPGNFPRSGPEVVERQRVAKESATQRVRSWTVQNEMRNVLGRVATGAAGRILDSANPREIGT